MTFLGSCTGQLYHKMCMKHNETIPYMDDRGSAALCDILSKRTPQPTDPPGHLVAGESAFGQCQYHISTITLWRRRCSEINGH